MTGWRLALLSTLSALLLAAPDSNCSKMNLFTLRKDEFTEFTEALTAVS
jgi:hypothetical protein